MEEKDADVAEIYGRDYVDLTDVRILPQPIGLRQYRSLQTDVPAIDYKIEFSHRGAYLLSLEDHLRLLDLVEEMERGERISVDAGDTAMWESSLYAREDGRADADRPRRTSYGRRSQARFRRDALDRYRWVCPVSGCNIAEAMEAAHVIAHNGDPLWDREENGLLLRRDLHAMFDALMWSIDPDTNKVVLSSTLKASLPEGDPYFDLEGVEIAHRVPEPLIRHHYRRMRSAI